MFAVNEKDLLASFDHSEKFKKIIINNHDFCVAAKTYPQYTDRLISFVLNNLSEFKRLIITSVDLLTIVKIFPLHVNTLIATINFLC